MKTPSVTPCARKRWRSAALPSHQTIWSGWHISTHLSIHLRTWRLLVAAGVDDGDDVVVVVCEIGRSCTASIVSLLLSRSYPCAPRCRNLQLRMILNAARL